MEKIDAEIRKIVGLLNRECSRNRKKAPKLSWVHLNNYAPDFGAKKGFSPIKFLTSEQPDSEKKPIGQGW